MKIKIYELMLCALVILPLMTGCDTKNADDSVPSVSDVQKTDAQGIPDDVQKSLQAALDEEPITIPAEEWTIETVCQATYINGINLTVPCTLNDLGEGFAVQESEGFPIAINEDNHRATAPLTYYGRYIGTVVVEDCDSEEDFLDSPIKILYLSFDEFEHTDISPVSCNGFGLNGTVDMLKKRLSFMDISYADEENDYYQFTKTIDNFEIQCTYSETGLTSFTIGFDITK